MNLKGMNDIDFRDEYFAVSGGKTVGTTCKNLLGFENFTSVSVLTMKNCRSFFGTLGTV